MVASPSSSEPSSSLLGPPLIPHPEKPKPYLCPFCPSISCWHLYLPIRNNLGAESLSIFIQTFLSLGQSVLGDPTLALKYKQPQANHYTLLLFVFVSFLFFKIESQVALNSFKLTIQPKTGLFTCLHLPRARIIGICCLFWVPDDIRQVSSSIPEMKSVPCSCI